MRSRVAFAAAFLSVCLLPGASLSSARDLSLEERVRAQEALDRVYHGHQLVTTRSFEETVSREVLERKVRTYLEQSLALERLWHTPVTAEMLQGELRRMARGTRMPHRLRELYAALDHDPFLIQECLARPALVSRVSRKLFAYDGRIHARARREAETLRRDLLEGRVDSRTEHILRRVVRVVREGG